MEDFIWRLAVAVIPLFLFIGATVLVSEWVERSAHHPLSWHRRRRAALRGLATGAALR